MENKVNKKKLLLKEIYNASSPFDGGFFGFGGNKQIIKKDPQVEKIEKQEQSEINQNLEDQNWILGKGILDKNINLESTEETSLKDSKYLHFPGSLKLNRLEKPHTYIPDANKQNYEEEYYLNDILPNGYEHTNSNTETLSIGGMSQLVKPKQFIPENESEKNVYYEKRKRKEKNKDHNKSNIDKNFKTIKKYLNLLYNAKPTDLANFTSKIDIEIRELENKLKISEQVINFNKLSNIIKEIIKSELKNDKYQK